MESGPRSASKSLHSDASAAPSDDDQSLRVFLIILGAVIVAVIVGILAGIAWNVLAP